MSAEAVPLRVRRTPGSPMPFVAPDAARSEPLHRQLYDSIRAAIISGHLPAGSRLPSSRALAAETGVSRVTVNVAFDQLRAEGYLDARTGSGTFVTSALPEDALQVRRLRAVAPPRAKVAPASGVSPRLPAARALPHVMPTHQTAAIAFISGIPALDLFPSALWSRLSARRWQSVAGAEGARLLNYGNPMGYFPLRRAIAHYVALSRGVRCDPGQVIVTAGAQQALDLSARVLLQPGEAVWLENPVYFGARVAFEGAGATIIPVPVDAEGLDVAAGEASNASARLAYVSPSHQFPLGVTMSMRRRIALLDWAARVGAWVVEDDYDGEFRYVGRPFASLQGLDADRCASGSSSGAEGRVLYVGTFSKTLCPALRLGYLIVPPALVDAFAAAQGAALGHTATVDQAVLADFMDEGHFARHVRRMRLVYAERQEAMVAAAAAHLTQWVTVRPAAAGMHLVGWLNDDVSRRGISDQQLADVALASGVVTTPLSSYRLSPISLRQRHPRRESEALLFGYAGYSEDIIRDAARKLEQAFAAQCNSGSRQAKRRRANVREHSTP